MAHRQSRTSAVHVPRLWPSLWRVLQRRIAMSNVQSCSITGWLQQYLQYIRCDFGSDKSSEQLVVSHTL